MLNIKQKEHVSNNNIHGMTNTKPLVYCVRKYQLGFLRHMLKLPDEEEPTRRYALYIPSHSKRKPGCPRTSYLAYMQHGAHFVLTHDYH